MSAAVVPGAKLLPTTTKGPDAPLMDKPVLGSRILAWLILPDSMADNRRSGLARRFWAGLVGFEGLLEGLVGGLPEGLPEGLGCDRAGAGAAGTGLAALGREEVDAER